MGHCIYGDFNRTYDEWLLHYPNREMTIWSTIEGITALADDLNSDFHYTLHTEEEPRIVIQVTSEDWYYTLRRIIYDGYYDFLF